MTDVQNGAHEAPAIWKPGELGLELTDEALRAQLHALVDRARAEREDHETKAAAARAQERRYERALAALEDEPKGKPGPKPKKSGSNDWSISEQKVESVYQRFVVLRAESPDVPITAGYLADNTPKLSPETARRALNELRAQERVRISGTTRGGGKKWDLMPEAEDAA